MENVLSTVDVHLFFYIYYAQYSELILFVFDMHFNKSSSLLKW